MKYLASDIGIILITGGIGLSFIAGMAEATSAVQFVSSAIGYLVAGVYALKRCCIMGYRIAYRVLDGDWINEI